ncbi:MAG: 4-hydroxy-tetrahydrodipicolinate synthase [Thermodesulfobacteriota bacterium]
MLHGSLVALVTPFKKNLSLDEAAIERLVEFHRKNGTHGIISCGTTGESATLSHDEHKRVVELTVKLCGGKLPVVAGTGSNSTDEAVDLTRFAEKTGADAALVVVPYYNKPSQQGLFIHFGKVASSVGIPIILYNVPGRSAANLLPETVARLRAKYKNIAGIKEASSIEQASKVMYLCGKDFPLFSGDDAINFPLLALGSRGSISVTANVAPKDVANMHNLYAKGETARAAKLHYKLLPLNEALFVESNPVPVKTALSLMKMDTGVLRHPLCALSPANRKLLAAALSDYGIV